MDGPSVSEYQAWLTNGAYSAVLFDGALVQISFEFRHSKIVGHRLAYVPCPFDLEPEYLQTEPLYDLVEAYATDVQSKPRLRSAIRFDFDPAAVGPGHPASHVTMFWPHCRIACVAPLSLGRFIRFIFYNFYPAMWENHLNLFVTGPCEMSVRI